MTEPCLQNPQARVKLESGGDGPKSVPYVSSLCRVVALGARAEPLATTTRTVEPTARGGQISKINKTRCRAQVFIYSAFTL